MKSKNIEKNDKRGDLKRNLFAILAGTISGLINGVFGGGGGMIVVPMLIYLLGREQKKAHATAILIILPLSIVSGLFYAMFGSFKFKVGIPAGIGVIIGGIIGALALKKLSSKWVNIIFSLVMLGTGIKLTFF